MAELKVAVQKVNDLDRKREMYKRRIKRLQRKLNVKIAIYGVCEETEKIKQRLSTTHKLMLFTEEDFWVAWSKMLEIKYGLAN